MNLEEKMKVSSSFASPQSKVDQKMSSTALKMNKDFTQVDIGEDPSRESSFGRQKES